MSKSTRSRKSSTRAEQAGRKAGAPVRPSGSQASPGAAVYLDRALAVAALAAVGIGVWARFKGLGTWPVSYDEFLTGSSVRAILKTGIPTYGESGIYVRGLLVQYLQAGTQFLGFGEEFSLRAVSALAGVGSLAAVFLLSRKVSGRTAALLATAAVALSAWEIEFARFGRAYAANQCLFLWFAFFLHRYLVEGDRKGWRGACLLAFVGIFVHESAPFLFLLLLFATIALRRPLPAKDLATILLGFVLAFAYNSVNFRNLGGVATAGRVAAGFGRGPAKGALLPPPFLGSLVLDNPLLLVPALLLLAFSAYVAWTVLRDRGIPIPERGTLTAAIALSLLNLFGGILLLILAVVLAGAFGLRNDRGNPRVRRCIFAVAANFAFWAGVLLFLPLGASLKAAGGDVHFATLFSYPEVWRRILSLWYQVLPAFSLMGAGFLVWWIFDLRRSKEGPAREGGCLAGLLMLGTIALLGVSRTPWLSTRYSFVFYPLLLVVVLDAMKRLADVVTANETGRRVALGVLFVGFLAFSEDVRADRLFRVDSAAVNFRQPYVPLEMHHFVPRFDYRTPAASVNAERKPGDIVVSCVLPPNFYLRTTSDYFVIPRKDPEYGGLVDARGRERWTGAAVLDKESDLIALLDDTSRSIWVIAGSESFPFGRGIPQFFARRYPFAMVRQGVDGSIAVYRFPAGRPPVPAEGNAAKPSG